MEEEEEEEIKRTISRVDEDTEKLEPSFITLGSYNSASALKAVIPHYSLASELVKPCSRVTVRKYVSALSTSSALIALAGTSMSYDTVPQEKMLHHLWLAWYLVWTLVGLDTCH